MLLLRSVAVVKLGCLFHPVVETGRLLPAESKAPATKESIPPSLRHHHPDLGRAGRELHSPAREDGLG